MNRAFCTNRPIETSDEIRRNMFLVFDEQERQGESPQSPNSAAPFIVLPKSAFGEARRGTALHRRSRFSLTLVCPSYYHAFRSRGTVIDLFEKNEPIAQGTFPRGFYPVGLLEFFER